MSNTINDKLNQLREIKAGIRNAINDVAETTLVPTDACFSEYAGYIRQLCKCHSVTYTVTFNTNGGSGSVPSKTGIQSGSSITLPSYNGTKEGYTQVKGWATSSSATSPIYTEGQNIQVTGNMTLYAVWKANEQPQWTVTFDSNGGTTPPNAITVQAGQSLRLPEYTGTRTGYTMVSGWALSSTATTSNYTFQSMFTPSDNTTLYAVWTKNSYQLSWVNPTNGTLKVTVGGVVKTGTSETVAFGTSVKFECTPNAGYNFSTWTGNGIPNGVVKTSTTISFNMPASDVTNISATLINSSVVTLNISGAFRNKTVLEKYISSAKSITNTLNSVIQNRVDGVVNTNGYAILIPQGHTLHSFSWIDAANNEVSLNVTNYNSSLSLSSVITKGLPKSSTEQEVVETINVGGIDYVIYNALITVTPTSVKYIIK